MLNYKQIGYYFSRLSAQKKKRSTNAKKNVKLVSTVEASNDVLSDIENNEGEEEHFNDDTSVIHEELFEDFDSIKSKIKQWDLSTSISDK